MLRAGIYSSRLQGAVAYDVMALWSVADDPNFPQQPSTSLNFPVERYEGILQILPLIRHGVIVEALRAFSTGAYRTPRGFGWGESNWGK